MQFLSSSPRASGIDLVRQRAVQCVVPRRNRFLAAWYRFEHRAGTLVDPDSAASRIVVFGRNFLDILLRWNPHRPERDRLRAASIDPGHQQFVVALALQTNIKEI